jgi:alkanesulfonate monooxygenase SsuD/methylene tetrahydromethanopterin reductase-like flavin-dependent oxidoreductase (luciferase family)
MANGTALVGSPRTVARQIRTMVQETGINYFLGVFNFGDLAQARVMRSLELFAAEVMPALATLRR